MASAHHKIFIQGLSENEIQLISRHLKTKSGKAILSKEAILFEAYTQKPILSYTDNELEKLTGSYGNALRTLKSRLFDTATEALLLDAYILDADLFNENDKIVNKLWKQFLVFKVLNRTNRSENYKITLGLLNQIIDKAKVFEVYDVLKSALIQKKYIVGLRAGINVFDQINNDIIHYSLCSDKLYFAADCFFKLSMQSYLLSLFPGNKLTVFLKESIRKMESDFKQTKSLCILYYLHIFKIAFAEDIKDYQLAVNQCKKLQTFLKKSKIVYRRERMGIVHSNLSLYYTLLMKYDNARAAIAIAKKCFGKNSWDYFSILNQEFLIEFQTKNFDNSLKVLDEFSSHTLSDAGQFQKSKYDYYRAYTMFAKKDFKGALTILASQTAIEKDKAVWNTGLKILIIQTYIELNKFDEASRALESLRKHVERHNKGGKIKKRDLLIIKTLKEFEKDGFNYSLKSKTIPKLLKTLAQKNKATSWEHKTPELIPFHEWLENR